MLFFFKRNSRLLLVEQILNYRQTNCAKCTKLTTKVLYHSHMVCVCVWLRVYTFARLSRSMCLCYLQRWRERPIYSRYFTLSHTHSFYNTRSWKFIRTLHLGPSLFNFLSLSLSFTHSSYSSLSLFLSPKGGILFFLPPRENLSSTRFQNRSKANLNEKTSMLRKQTQTQPMEIWRMTNGKGS